MDESVNWVNNEWVNDDIRVVLNCGQSTAREVVPLAIDALRAANLDNWKRLSPLPPGFWPDFDEALNTAESERIIAEIEDSRGYLFDTISFYFPNCCHDLTFDFSKYDNGLFVIEITIPARALSEVEGTPRRGEMVWNWHKSRKSFDTELPGPDDFEEDELRQWHDEYNRLGDTPSLWPQTRECFLNVVNHLKEALPNANVKTDERLLI
jgi:hypothetical protein